MSDLRAAAREWFNQGFNVVAVKFEEGEDGKVSKKPLVEWSEWINRRQTLEEFEAQPWDRADGFAIVCSWPNNEGLYLAVIDYDVKRVSEEAKRRGEELFNRFPITRMERSISSGQHKIYLSKVKPRPISQFHDTHALELIAGAKLCVMAPSKGYKALNDNPPRVVEDVEGLFYQILGVEDARNINKDINVALLQAWLEELKPHLDIRGEGPNYFYVRCPFHKPDNHPSFALHKTKFYGIDYHDGKVYSLRDLAEALGVQLPGLREEIGLGEGEEEGKVNLFALAKEIVSECPICTDIRTYLMYRWNGKVWVDDAEGYIHKRLVDVEGEGYKPYHLTTLTQIVQGLTFNYGLEEPSPNLICFENGVLDLNTMELQPHNPKLFFRNVIHAKYNPNAKAEKFLKWLEEVLPDEESRLLAQEIFGYCFYRDYPLHHIFFLVGVGRNGKGVFTRTIEAILGKENCSNIPLERLAERFQATNLIGKLANIVSEPDIKRISIEMVKALTGQDLISGEIKGKQKFINFTNYAKLIVIANRLPPISDKSIAWWERVILLEFPIVIPEDKRIPNIEHQWLSDEEERSGIVNWALEGLKRLLQNRRFTKSRKMEEMIEEYKRWSNPVDYFLDKCCEFAPNLWVGKKELYDAYKEFCEEEGLQIVSEEIFSREVRKRPRVTIGQKRVEGRKIRCWIGIGLKPEEEGEGEISLNQASFGASGAGGTGIAHPGKAYESCNTKNDNFIQYIEPVPPAPLAPPKAFWVCTQCAREMNIILLVENEGGVCEVCGAHDVPVGRVPAEFIPKPEGSKAPSELLKCSRCNAQFASESDLLIHMRGVHGVEG